MGRIDTILLSSDADKDSFAEIVTLINSVDTANDDALAGYVVSNNDRSTAIETSVSDEITTRSDADTTLQSNLDTVANDRYTISATDNKFVQLTGGTINGDLTVTGTLSADELVETSSIRFKENVKSIENAFDTVSKLQGVTYDWIESGKADIGFIAEEVEKVIPELVKKNDDGIVEGMNYGKLTAMLVEVVKTQQAQIDELKLDVDFLKRK